MAISINIKQILSKKNENGKIVIFKRFLEVPYIGFFGEFDNKIVCSTSLLIYNYPPLYSEDYRKIGHVLNFYTRKEYRNCGYGYKLMEYLKNYTREKNMYKLDLAATEVGYPLYKKCGFIDSIRIMELEIR